MGKKVRFEALLQCELSLSELLAMLQHFACFCSRKQQELEYIRGKLAIYSNATSGITPTVPGAQHEDYCQGCCSGDIKAETPQRTPRSHPQASLQCFSHYSFS